ncbi:MAG: ornithine cyclodeaminase family protein [Casimicrobiaceae bacterium]
MSNPGGSMKLQFVAPNAGASTNITVLRAYPTTSMIRHIREEDVRRVLTMATTMAIVETAMRARTDGRAVDEPRTMIQFPGASLRVLAAQAPYLGLAGYKATYAEIGAAARGYLHLIDAESGELRAVIESVHLSVMRTGAASGIATRTLARGDASIVALLGTGTQAMGQLEATCAVRTIKSVRVWSRNAERVREFCARAERLLRVAVSAAKNGAEAVRGADIINVITSSATPVLLGDWLEPGQHINAAGANTLSRRELDEMAVQRCDRIVVDARDVAQRECGDLHPLVEAGLRSWDALPELGEVLAGTVPGRAGPSDITLYESHGIGVQDLYAAKFVYDALQ